MTAAKTKGRPRWQDGPSVAELIRLADLIDPDQPDYQAFLRRWGSRYSPRNLQMLWVQCPTATSLHTYKGWQSAGLQVRKGEKAIWLFKPSTRIDHAAVTERNPDGDVLTGISLLKLFDITQTDLGEPVDTDDPDLLAELKRLRMEAASVHPDRGGTAAEFMAAWQRYEEAKARATERTAIS